VAAVILAAALLCGGVLAGCTGSEAPGDGRPQGGATSLAAGASAAGTGGEASSTPASPAPAAIAPELAAAVEWRPCDAGYQCATVTVPLDHDQPAGPTIDLALIRLEATGERRGSIFVNPGGPGASGVGYVKQGFRLDADTMAAYDLVGFDPRGVGDSSQVGCDLDRSRGPLPDFSPDTPEERRQLDASAEQLARSCAEQDAELLAHLDTGSVARDLDLLRQAVGDDRLHYLGFSFGTLIGLLYADLHPDRVGHMALDGVVDPTASVADLLDQQARAFELAFSRLDDACSDGLTCPPGGIAATYDRLMAELESRGPAGEVGPAELEIATLVALYDDGLWPTYAEALGAAAAGDLGQIELLSDAYNTSIGFTSYAAVVCSDSPRPDGPEGWDRLAADLAASAPRFGAALANELRACAYWPVAAGPARDPVQAAGSAPILVIGTTNDPATPLVNAEVVADHLDQASLVILGADRHTAYSASTCIQRIVRDYFVDDELPPSTVSC
jgi:pimeloyl-ACP methyl ester carboxylesterase